MFAYAQMVHFGLEQPNLKNMLGPLVTNAEYGCFKNGRDVLLAPYFHPRASVVEDVHGRLALQGGAERLLQSKNVRKWGGAHGRRGSRT